jgi:hypothetical protein
MIDDEDRDDEGGISEVNREGKIINKIISPISQSGKNYFSQNQVVSLVNCQKVEQKLL